MFDFTKKKEFKIFFCIWIIYIFFISSYAGDWMAEPVLHSAMAVVDKGNFVVDEYIRDIYMNKSNPVSYGGDYAFANGHFYSGFGPGLTILAIPLYIISKPFMLLIPEGIMGFPSIYIKTIILHILSIIFVSSLLSALTAVLLYKLLGEFIENEKYKLLITFTLSFGTLFFLYSTTYCKKITSVFFLFFVFYKLFLIKKHKKFEISNYYLILLGFMLGFSVMIDYPLILLVPFISLYVLDIFRNKKIIYFAIGILIPLLMLLGYHYLIFNNPLTLPYSPTVRANVGIQDTHSLGYDGIYYPTFESVWGNTFSPFRGIFFYIPILLLSFYGMYLGFKKKVYIKELLLILLIFFTHFFYTVSFIKGWHSGPLFGPRLLITTIPFLMIPLVFVFGKIRFIYITLVSMVSIFINLFPVMYTKTIFLLKLDSFDKNPIFNQYLPLITKGIRNYTLNLIEYKIYPLSNLIINIISISSLIMIGILIYFVWKRKEFIYY